MSKKLLRIEKQCQRCGKAFISVQAYNRKFCSKKCAPPPRPASEKPGVKKNCRACEKEFYIRFSHKHQKYCSKACQWSVAKVRNPGYGTITIEMLEEYLSYDPETGLLRWIKSPMTKIREGDLAGTINGDGYLQIILNGKHISGHIAAWVLFHKRWPKEQVDHKNGNRSENAITNLREATLPQNSFNRGLYSNNKSGVPGVFWSILEQKWKVGLNINKKHIHLGTFKYKEDAIKVRRDAEEEYFGEFRRDAG